MLGLTPHLPDALVWLAPRRRGGVGDTFEEDSIGLGDLAHLLPQAVDGVEQLAVDVGLVLVPGAVAHPYRSAAAPAVQVRQLALDQVVLAADAVHDLQAVLLARRTCGPEDPIEEAVGLVRAGGHPRGWVQGVRAKPRPVNDVC